MIDEYELIQNSVGFILYRTALALKAALQRRFKENGFEITGEQWGIIRHLWEEEGISQREIGEKASKDKPNITRMLDALEGKHLIYRQPHPQDRRKFCLYLTAEGKQLHERLFPLVQALWDQIIRDLSPPEVEFFKKVLHKIHLNICQP
jgi:DNA-binding MarR family transcriptional regulator